MMKAPLNILIVEDEVMIGELLASDLTDAGHKVNHIAYEAKEALDFLAKNPYDLALLDINLEDDMDGIDIAKVINTKYKIPFIFITAYSDLSTIERAKHVEPCAYIIKPYRAEDLLASITIGLYNFNGRKNNTVLNKEKVDHIALDPLTEKEFNIIKDITHGLTNAQIAHKQEVSVHTIKWHTQNIYSKLDVKNRTSVAKLIHSLI